MSGFRAQTGGLIDRSRRLQFTFDGQSYTGHPGDTLASALMANGVRVLGRSFKYHRPRGVWGAWVDEPNAIMTVRLGDIEMPNSLATTTPLEDGMQARAVNTWPSAYVDLKGGLDLFHRWLGAGFYYKTFMWPDWHLFEPFIRKMAGLSGVSPDHPTDYTADQVHDHCETLVVGGGIAGLVAARAAAEAGQDVVLVEDHDELGGSAYQVLQIAGLPTHAWIAAQGDALLAAGGRVMTRTTAIGVYDHGMVALVSLGAFGQAPRLTRMRAGRIIMATGALDRPVTFPENDRPGVMSAMAAAEYLARYGVLPGRDAVLASNHSLTASLAETLANSGMRIAEVDPAHGLRARGGKRLNAVEVDGARIEADTLLVSGGLTPLVHLWRHAGGKLDWCETRQAFVPGTPPDGMQAIGAANGTFDLDAAMAEAAQVGAGEIPARLETMYSLTPLWPKPGATGRQWIDFQHDVTLKDVELAARENYVSVEHLKRYTTLGMASDQGKTSNMAGLAAMAAIQGRPMPEVGTMTFRPPFVPIPIETYHGARTKQNWNPVKRLPLEAQHRALDAALCEYGGWLRPGWYGSGKPEDHIQQEARTVRSDVGIFDGSPLGKIEVMGPDAEAFVNFIYYNTIKTLKVGAIRYGFMLTEGGVVYDDGVVARLAEDRFLISCSSSHVDGVRTHLEAWRQDGNDPDRIFVHDVTQHWATITITGPKAQSALEGLTLGEDMAGDAFPHMTFRDSEFRDTPVRVARVSFTGELSYEISIRAAQAADVWAAALEVGAPLGMVPFGIEALSILRAEKGFVMIGKDTDGETMPHDLGFAVPRLKKSAAFVGDRSLHMAVANGPDRKQLVGLRVPDGAAALPTGAHVVEGDTSLGYVTSSYDSPNIGAPVALAMIARGASRHGEQVEIWHMGERRAAEICAPCVFDPEGERLNAG